MAKAGRIIVSAVLIFVVIGIVLVAVGMFTGASPDRIYQTVADRYDLVDDYRLYIRYFSDVAAELQQQFSAFYSEAAAQLIN